MKSAKKNKKTVAKPEQNKTSGFNWTLFGVVTALVAVVVICGILAAGQKKPADSGGPGVTAGPVDTSNLVPMRVVNAVSAYVLPDVTSSSIYSLRRGDVVQTVSSKDGWTTIAVEGRGYFVPTSSLRGVEEYLIVLDAGHQLREDLNKEALGPGAPDTEFRMDAGSVGVATGQQEYDLTLEVCKRLKSVLEKRGYQVVLIRNHNAVSISYVERAQVANKLYADAYITLHAGFSEDETVQGVNTICQTSENAYNAGIYKECHALAKAIMDGLVNSTGAAEQKVKETDKMSGLNWCQVPMTYVEMGYLSNANEDRMLSADSYQQKLAVGIADGLDAFFADEEK